VVTIIIHATMLTIMECDSLGSPCSRNHVSKRKVIHMSVGIGEKRTFAGLGVFSIGCMVSIWFSFFSSVNMSTNGQYDILVMLTYNC